MAITTISYEITSANYGVRNFSFPFPYLIETDIKVTLNKVLTTEYTFANATEIRLNTVPPVGTKIRIFRLTSYENLPATFYPGSAIRAQDLNFNYTQGIYVDQDIQNTYVPLYDAVLPDDLSLDGNQINNVKDPTSAQDAATKNYVDTTTVASAGDNMTGNLAMGTNKVTGLGEPTASQDAATKNYVDTTTWNVTSETLDSTEAWVSNDSVIATTGATTKETDTRYDTLVQTTTPVGSSWRTGKTWLQNDVNNTLSMWDGSTWKGISSGGTFTTQPTVVYVDNVNGSDTNDGHRIINPKKTIKAAVASAQAGWIIKVAPGVYTESLPIDITVANLSIVGEAQRSCFINPTVATETQIMFRCNSGTYIDGFTFAGLKASGTRGGNAIDTDATYGLPTNQGWVAGFYPGCTIRKSPFINNCTNFADSGIDNSAFDPNNYSGTGGDLTSGPAGGGIIVDGSLPNINSPLRSFVINEFTQVCLDGPGLLVCNNGYAQAVSFFGLFCHYHVKALSGGQINMEVGTTDFGRYGLIADGKSSAAIFTATANGAASASATSFAINAPTAGGSWFGDANRPAINMLAQVTVSGTTYTYPILSSTANGSGWNVVISRPNPSNRAENLGLSVGHASGATWSFFLRSMVSTASHTMEYAGSGCNYNALPENGGVAVETNEAISRNNGKVWLTSTDQSGKFKVGDTFVVDQQTGFVNLDPSSYGVNIVSDLSPELGGDLDTLTRRIYSSLSAAITFGNPINETVANVVYPVVSQVDIGTDPNQVPLNQYLGTLAFQDSIATQVNTQVFTTSGTWTKPAGVSQVRVVAIGGGGGGGSGCKGTAGTQRTGGVGGLKGNYFDTTLRASDLTSTVSVAVGSGGTGGASQTTNTTAGNAGAAGGNTTFGSYLTSYGGAGGLGGIVANNIVPVALERITTELNYIYKQNVTGTATVYAGANVMTTLGGSAANITSSYGGMYGNFGPGGGSGGGVINSANAITTSFGYGGSGSMLAVVCPGGTPTLTDGSTGGAGTNAAANQPYGGGGGSGGQSSLVGNAGAGGAGGLYGGGGGGGGASVDSVGNSGTGGAGAAGICVVISW